MLHKTLTFGLGKMMGYDARSRILFELDESIRKRIYEEILRGFRDFARLCNYMTNLLYIGKILKIDLETIGFNTGYKPILEKLKLKTPLSGKILCQSFQIAKSHFNGENGKRLMGKGDMVLPTHRLDGTHPLNFRSEGVRIHMNPDNNALYIAYALFASKWAEQDSMPAWVAFRIHIKNRDHSGYSQLERVLTGEWKHGGGQLVKNKRDKGKKYLMHLSVQYEPHPNKALTPETVAGIALGVSVPVAIHIRTNGSAERWAMLVGDGKVMKDARDIVRMSILRLLRGLKKKDSLVTGPAREAAIKRLRELRKQESRIMKTATQKLASMIAEQAKRNGAGLWQIENVPRNHGFKPWLVKNWAAGVLIDAVRWQAERTGAKFVVIGAPYEKCSKCGHTASANVVLNAGQTNFMCVNCGYTEHPDKNAARNMSTAVASGNNHEIKNDNPGVK